MLCEQVHEHLSAYLDKELTAELSAAVRSHLDSCAECRTLLAELRATADLLGRLPVHAAPEQMAQDVQRQIERRALVGGAPPAEEQPRERTLPVHRARLWPRALAVAATVALAAGIGILAYLTQNQQGPIAPEVASPVLLPESQPLADAGDRSTLFRSDNEKKPAKPEDQLASLAKHGTTEAGKPIVNPADQVALVPTPAAPTVDRLKGVGLPEGLDGAAPRRRAEPADLKREAKRDEALRLKDDSLAMGPAAAPTATRGGAGVSPGYKFEAPSEPLAPAPEKAKTGKRGSAADGVAEYPRPKGPGYGNFEAPSEPPPPAPEKAEIGKRGIAEKVEMEHAKPIGAAYGSGAVSGTERKAGEAGGKDTKQRSGALALGMDSSTDQAAPGQMQTPAAVAPSAIAKAPAAVAVTPAGPAPGAAPAMAPAVQTPALTEELAPAKRYAKTEEAIEGKSAGDQPAAERSPTDNFGRPRPETRAEPERPAAPPAPPPMSVAAAPAAKLSSGLGSAPMEKAVGASIVLTGPAAVRQAMVSVVGGRAALEDLKAVATRDNLSRAEYQLVLVADSRREGSQALQQMFQSNGWQAVSAGKTAAEFGAMKRMAEDSGGTVGGRAGGGAGAARAGTGWAAGAAKPLPPGVYYAAPNGAEDTWVVLTDRDSLSRFGGQLLLAQDLSVAPDSSAVFRSLARERTGQRLMTEAKDARSIAAGLNAGKAKEAEARENRAPAAADPLDKLKEAERPDREGYQIAKVGPRPPQEAGAQAEAAGESSRTGRAGTAPSGAAAGAAAPSADADQLPPVRLTTPGKPAATAPPSSAKAPAAQARYFGAAADKAGTAAGGDRSFGFLGDSAHRLEQTDDKVLVVIRVRQADAADKASQETKPGGVK
jgi:hypothetical protein